MRMSDWSSDVCSSDLGKPAHGTVHGLDVAEQPAAAMIIDQDRQSTLCLGPIDAHGDRLAIACRYRFVLSRRDFGSGPGLANPLLVGARPDLGGALWVVDGVSFRQIGREQLLARVCKSE